MTTSTAVLRPIRPSDAESLWAMLEPASSELVGMTSLPASMAQAQALCAASASTVADLAAGAHEPPPDSSASVVFVLVDDDSVIGLSGVTFKYDVPNIAVQVVTSDDGLGLDMLSSAAPWTRTELNSSFVAQRARGRGFGPLLSRGRFMFLHQVHRQVPTTIASHLRGSFSADGTAPFWSCFGDHLTEGWIDSVEAEHALAEDPSRLDSLVGHRRPVTAEVLDSLGPVNTASLPAFRILMREGLRPNGMYDPIDGGPTLVAEREHTMTGKHRRHGRARVTALDQELTTAALVAVTGVDDFRVALLPVMFTDHDIVISEQAAQQLGVDAGSLLAVAPMEEG